MPWGDGTGPLGLGPRTGRGAGYCAGYNMPGYMNPIPGSGRGFGRGFGRGYWGRGRRFWWRHYPVYYEPAPYHNPYYRRPYSEPDREEEKRYLEETINDLEEELKTLKNRLQEIKKEENP